jgi:fructokinase
LEVVDTVGAGDTFQSAMLSWLGDSGNLTAAAVTAIDSFGLHEMLAYAVHAAALTCTRLGANLPLKAEVAAWMSQQRSDTD